MITYTLEELYQLRASPLTAAPIPDSLQQLLQPGKVGRWNNVRRHEPLAKGGPTVAPGGGGGAAKVNSPLNEAKSPPLKPTTMSQQQQPVAAPLLACNDSPAPAVTVEDSIKIDAEPPPDMPLGEPSNIEDSTAEERVNDNNGPPPGWSAPIGNSAGLPMWCQPHQYGMPDADQMGFDEWDSPLPSSGPPGDIENFTLGDIRAAETAVESMGVPLQVYIDRVKKQGQASASCDSNTLGNLGLSRQANTQLLSGAADPLGQPTGPFGPQIGINQQSAINPMTNAAPAGGLPAVHSLLGRGRQDIFFNEQLQTGESKFMNFFAERSRRAEESRLNGNATPFYPSKYSPPGFDDPRKYAPFLPQATRVAGAGRQTPMGFNNGYDDPQAKQIPPSQSQQPPPPQAQRDLQTLLMRLARQQGNIHPGQPQNTSYYDSNAMPSPQQQSAYLQQQHHQQQQQQQQHLNSAVKKVTPQQLLQVIQSMSKNNNQELSARQKDLLRFAMTRISQLQAQQQQQQQQQQSQSSMLPNIQAQQAPAGSVYHPPPPPPPNQMLNCQPRLTELGQTHPMIGLPSQQQQQMMNAGPSKPGMNSAVGLSAYQNLDSYRDLQPSEKITAIAEALQKTLQQQKAKGITPTAGQKQTLIQVLNALQKLKAQKNAANSGLNAQSGQVPTDLYGAVYPITPTNTRKNTDCGAPDQQVRKENNIGIDE